jgi:hypothetical protein
LLLKPFRNSWKTITSKARTKAVMPEKSIYHPF